ncbi:MAG: ArsB/NhaD family transporter [Anaerolineae bacterium]
MTLPQIIASLIFVAVFGVILSERLHRTIVAMTGASVMLLAGLGLGFYTQEQALRAVDFNTLGLLLGMMILVQLLQQTGFFRYVAILTGKRSAGSPWRLLIILGIATTVLSMFLDNVTTIVLIAPVTILIAEIVGIATIPLLVAEALLSNVGGVATLVGDPPNVLIGSAAGFTFDAFLTHLAPIVLIAWPAALFVLWLAFRRELAVKPKEIEALLRLDEREALRDPVGMRKILIVLAGVIVLFFLQGELGLRPSTIALGGAAAALLWMQPDIEETLRHVEWSVLFFFAALFIITGGLEASGVLRRLAGAVVGSAQAHPLADSLVLLWLAAGLSAVVDNIPFTIALIPVIQELAGLGAPAAPLWWALALGAGLGGNGTPIGATANVITVALSGRTRTPITTRIWLRSGLPVMLVTCIIASLLFALFFGWMNTP